MCGRNARLAAILSVGLLSFGVLPAIGDEVVLTSVKDTTLYEDASATSNGSGILFFIGKTAAAAGFKVRRGLLKFDPTAGIPAGSKIDNVELEVEVYATAPSSGTRLASVHRVLADWGEAGSEGLGTGAPAQTGDATWKFRFFDTIQWATQGGDFVPLRSASVSMGLPGDYVFASTPELIADVQFWLDQPDSNFGWIMIGDEVATQVARGLGTREIAAPNGVPMLRVTFTPPATLPGDCDDDRDVDLVDFTAIRNCQTGPSGGPVPPACICVDFDGDEDVDRADQQAFQIAFGQ